MTLEHNNASASNLLLNISTGDETLDANGEMAQYACDNTNSTWRQMASNSA